VSRLKSDFWVSAYLRRCAIAGLDAVLRRRGAAEAGAIFVKLDHLDGTASLFGPAPQALVAADGMDRVFTRLLDRVPPLDVEERVKRETRFDPDLWLVEVDSREGRHDLDLADEDGPP
jgi:hypothetical protein